MSTFEEFIQACCIRNSAEFEDEQYRYVFEVEGRMASASVTNKTVGTTWVDKRGPIERDAGWIRLLFSFVKEKSGQSGTSASYGFL